MKSRKLLAILMVSVMLLGSFATVGAAADTTASSIDDHLVVHYDFEGLTKEEAMKDKAPAGTTKDNLTVLDHQNVAGAASYINFDLDNGTVKRTRVWTQLTAAVSDDILSLNNKATVFIRFKLPKLDTNYPMLDLYNKTDNAPQTRFNTLGTGMETKFVGGCRTSTNGYLQYQVACNDMRTTEEFVNFAVTFDMKKNDLGGGAYSGKILYYASVGELNEDTDWFAIGDKTPTNNADSLVASTDELVFTVLGYADGSAGKTDMIFDDIRIYNTVLTEDEIATIRLGTAAEGGNTEGGNTEGGNTEGGNTEGGNTEGGNTEGGNTNSDNTDKSDDTEAETKAESEETTAEKAETTAEAEEKGGCGAAIGSGIGVVVASSLCAYGLTSIKPKRKK